MREAIVSVVKKYRPPKFAVHNILFLEEGPMGLRWELTVTGVYSAEVARELEALIASGAIKECPNGRLTLDSCPEEMGDFSWAVSEATREFVGRIFSLSRGPPSLLQRR